MPSVHFTVTYGKQRSSETYVNGRRHFGDVTFDG